MTEVTRILTAVERGDANAAGKLLPFLHDELHELARGRLNRETGRRFGQEPAPAQEPINRLVDLDKSEKWNGRGHFFAAAAEALRRILVENARSQAGVQRLGVRAEALSRNTREFQDFALELVALDEALSFLGKTNAMAEQLAQLRYFAGLTSQEAADAMGISTGAADRTWGYARAWLLKQLHA